MTATTQFWNDVPHGELAASAAAARALLERDRERYRAMVAPTVEAWRLPELPPVDVHEVRQLLSDD